MSFMWKLAHKENVFFLFAIRSEWTGQSVACGVYPQDIYFFN